VPADAGVAESSKSVLEDTEAGQHLDGVEEVEDQRQEDGKAAELLVAAQQDGQSQAELSADGGDLHLGLFFVPGEGEQVEKGNTEQDLDGEAGRVVQGERLDVAEEGELHQSEPRQPGGDQAGGEGADEQQTQHLVVDLPQIAERQPGDGRPAQRRREQALEPFLMLDVEQLAGVIDAADRAADDAEIGQGGSFEQQKEHIGEEPAADAKSFADLREAGDEQSEDQAGQGGDIDPQQAGEEGVVIVGGDGGRLKGGVEDQAEVDAFEQVFGLQPAHGGSRGLANYYRFGPLQGIASGNGREERQRPAAPLPGPKGHHRQAQPACEHVYLRNRASTVIEPITRCYRAGRGVSMRAESPGAYFTDFSPA
jgi:hypothetical protein